MGVENSEQAISLEFFFPIFSKTKVLWSFGLKNMILEMADKTRFSLAVKRLHLKKTYFFPLREPLAFGKPRYSCNFHFQI